MSDSRPLEDKRGRAVNPTANKHYWELIENLVTKYRIREETTFGSDEVGVQSRGNERERVATSRKKKGPQYQQCAGTWKTLLLSLLSVLMELQHHQPLYSKVQPTKSVGVMITLLMHRESLKR